jgi:hypothetical protein
MMLTMAAVELRIAEVEGREELAVGYVDGIDSDGYNFDFDKMSGVVVRG